MPEKVIFPAFAQAFMCTNRAAYSDPAVLLLVTKIVYLQITNLLCERNN